MTLEDTHLMEVVERSPAAAGRRDRHGWVALFTADGSVEDPVGSQPHVGHTALGRFSTRSSRRGASCSTAISISSAATPSSVI